MTRFPQRLAASALFFGRLLHAHARDARPSRTADRVLRTTLITEAWISSGVRKLWGAVTMEGIS